MQLVEDMKEEEIRIRKGIRELFFDTYNRPKKSPMYESLIQRRLENRFEPKKVSYVLKKLEHEDSKTNRWLYCRSNKVKDLGKVKFYYPSDLNYNLKQKKRIAKRIEKITDLIKKYSNPDFTSAFGHHLHYLVKAELRAHGFNIVGEKTNTYDKKQWSTTKHTLDLIAKHNSRNIVIGVEVKNTLEPIPAKEIKIKLKMCKFLGITPFFACRWLGTYENVIRDSGGFPWQFKNQIHPICHIKLVEKVQNRLGLPMTVMHEFPNDIRKQLEDWLSKF